MVKSDHQDQGCLRFKWNVRTCSSCCLTTCTRFVSEFMQFNFAISCKIVMLEYSLLISLSITHSSMIVCNRPHPDHAQVKVGHTHATDMVK